MATLFLAAPNPSSISDDLQHSPNSCQLELRPEVNTSTKIMFVSMIWAFGKLSSISAKILTPQEFKT